MATRSIPHKSPLQLVLFIVLALFVLAFLSHGQIAPEVLRRGWFEEITDGDTGAYHLERYNGFQAFRMSADGSTVVFYLRDDALTVESLRIMGTDGNNESIIYERVLDDASALLISDCFDISDTGRYVGYVLAYAPGVGSAKQLVIYDAQSDIHHYLPDQTEIQLHGLNETGYVNFSFQNTADTFCLAGDGQSAYILNRFGPFSGGIDGVEPSGFTIYRFTLDGRAPVAVLSEHEMRELPGRDERAVALAAAGGWMDTDTGGSAVTITAGGYSHNPIPIHLVLASPGGSRIIMNLDGRGWSGASINGDGGTISYCRWGWESETMNGLFVASTSDGNETKVFAGVPEFGLYPSRPHISKDGSAIIFDWPHSNNEGLLFALSDGSLILPLTAGPVLYPEPDAYLSEDGAVAMIKGTVWPQGGLIFGPDLIRFEWREKNDTSFEPNIPTVIADPYDDFPLYSGLQPAFYHRMLYHVSGTNLGIAYSIPIGMNGLRPGAERGFDWAGRYDNGFELDDAAGDGIYTDSYVWMHTDFTEPYVTVRGAITDTNGAAGFVDVKMNTRAIVPCDAAFIVDVTEGPPPLTVTCTDQSTGDVVTRSWDCDGIWPPEYVDADETIQHTYTVAGVYTMQLVVDGFGGQDTAEVVITVHSPQDIDGSGGVDAVDVQFVIRGALDLPTNYLNCDVNGDGKVDAVDVQLVINAALGLI